MKDIAGEVWVRARLRAGRLREVTIGTRRPAVAQLLVGRSVPEALELLPRLFAICAHAQSAAACAAVAAAGGTVVGGECNREVLAEAVREHLIALLGVPEPELIRQCAVPAGLREGLARRGLGFDPAQWLAVREVAALQALAQRHDAPLCRELRRRLSAFEPPPSATALLQVTEASASFSGIGPLQARQCATPVWHDRPAESGAVARLSAHPLIEALRERPLLQRWCARLLEVAMFACEDPADRSSVGLVSGAPSGAASGRGSAVTARGLLLHELTLRDGRIGRYAILAPTEWNFHPSGTLWHWLDGTAAATVEEATERVRACAAALDPCVPCRIDIGAGP